MTGEIIFVLITLTCMVVALVFEVYKSELVVFITLMLFTITGVVSTQEAIAGFSHPVVITIGCLFIITGTISQSGNFERLISRMLDQNDKERVILAKLLIPLAIASAFFNNTPIVITLTSLMKDWCVKNNFSLSKFLIPISYITILGGSITILGTSTNLVINGFLQNEIGKGFSVFHLAMVGIPITVLGGVYISTIGYKLLPHNDILIDKVNQSTRTYLAEFKVTQEFQSLNESVERAGLRNLKDLYLISIIRGDDRLSPVKNTAQLQVDDHLIFTGRIKSISDLEKRKGLKLITDTTLNLETIKSKHSQFVEVVVSHESSLLYTKLKYSRFRARFNAAVLAVHRRNEKINYKIGDIVLKPGDTLLLITDQDFFSKPIEKEFYVATHTTIGFSKQNKRKNWIATLLFLMMISLVVFNILPLLMSSLLFTSLFLILRFVSLEQATHYIKFNILLLLASSFGIGKALINSGGASWIANQIFDLVHPYGAFIILLSIYVLTNIFTEIITNNASAIMMFPIAMEVGSQSGIPLIALATIVAIAASASFTTPIGYQTNFIVYSAGGYSYLDYVKVGLPLNFIVMTTTVTLVYFYWI